MLVIIMRIVYFANGPVALEILRFLRSEGEEIVALVLHDEGHRRLSDELIKESGLPPSLVFGASALRDPEAVLQLSQLGADIGFSALFGVILKTPVLQLFPRGVVNVHPGYLPYNRGRNPQIWAIIDGTPAGASLHYMDNGVDTGPLIKGVEVSVDLSDTGASLRTKLEQACVEVTRLGWPSVQSGFTPSRQEHNQGSAHRLNDVESINEIDLDATYRGRDLINLLRALSSPPQSRGAYFKTDFGRVWISVDMQPEADSPFLP
jgi:methionyl-tRNA formyltransferase